jgi:MvdC family ATP-grasp ribosomal peptide maturase
MKDNTVLLLTHSNDFYTIDKVEQSLHDLGAYPVRLNTDLFPQHIPMEVSFEEGNYKVICEINKEKIDFEEVKGIWYRRIWKPKLDKDIDPLYREMSIKESRSIFLGTLPFLSNAYWMDSFDTVQKASNKLLQLKIAGKIGMILPATLISNHSETVQSFFYKQEGEMIAKMAEATAIGMGNEVMALKTHKIEEPHLEGLDSLRYCPMIFQKEIPKECELRVVYVDGTFFTGAIDASDTALGKTDWRRSSVGEITWEAYRLPNEIQQQITLLMQELGLTFGAIDIIKTPDNQYVFLEVNPVGEWGMLQRDLGFPIAENIAKSIWKNIN